ncbi:hypothetical protein DPMN_166587 [Dreissena polymorpha]|uniref:Uncharacterized protein n=1 Tax=Dreissena polymorpha TaxID=45954 RepID=A0A9D4EZT0_DREPO|nr:hypothetical protein DPMN_166587 [Dreissena polymorpha]
MNKNKTYVVVIIVVKSDGLSLRRGLFVFVVQRCPQYSVCHHVVEKDTLEESGVVLYRL